MQEIIFIKDCKSIPLQHLLQKNQSYRFWHFCQSLVLFLLLGGCPKSCMICQIKLNANQEINKIPLHSISISDETIKLLQLISGWCGTIYFCIIHFWEVIDCFALNCYEWFSNRMLFWKYLVNHINLKNYKHSIILIPFTFIPRTLKLQFYHLVSSLQDFHVLSISSCLMVRRMATHNSHMEVECVLMWVCWLWDVVCHLLCMPSPPHQASRSLRRVWPRRAQGSNQWWLMCWSWWSGSLRRSCAPKNFNSTCLAQHTQGREPRTRAKIRVKNCAPKKSRILPVISKITKFSHFMGNRTKIRPLNVNVGDKTRGT